jgi:cbb3-type cytochrome oxidase subunit 3
MELWMYLFLIGMFLVAIVGTVWITLWTIQRGDRSRANRPDDAQKTE